MREIPTTEGNHTSSVENLEVQRWRVIDIDNKIGKTQATLFNFVFLIQGSITFTTFTQVPPSMYYAVFKITLDDPVNMYLVTNLVPLFLGCTFPLLQKYHWTIQTGCTTQPKYCYQRP